MRAPAKRQSVPLGGTRNSDDGKKLQLRIQDCFSGQTELTQRAVDAYRRTFLVP